MGLNKVKPHHIEHFYQPMWNLENWNIFGYEALMRFKDPSIGNNIEKVFDVARSEGYLFDMDTISITSAVKNFPLDSLKQELLFINIYPSTLLNDRFDAFLNELIKNYSIHPERIVFELNETKEEEDIWESPLLKDKILALKRYGFYVALDDIGKGVATLQKIIEFEPNYIKLDRYFSVGLSESKTKQKLISLFIEFSKHNMGLILEGIEKDVDLAQAKLINVPIVQGYLLGKPQKVTQDNIYGQFRNFIAQQKEYQKLNH